MIRFGDFDFIFQSTPPVKAATNKFVNACNFVTISIHAAREGGDNNGRANTTSRKNFNPRRP